MQIKDGIFTIGIDDAPHIWGEKQTELFFIFCRGRELENILHEKIDLDGFNATNVIINVLKPRMENFRLIVTHGITVGGFNPIDINRLSEELEVPVIAVTENQPRGDFLKAIENLKDFPRRSKILKSAGPHIPFETPIGKKKVYYQKAGIDDQSVQNFLKKFAIRSRLPEQVFLAHRIATGWSMPAIDDEKLSNHNDKSTQILKPKTINIKILKNKKLEVVPDSLRDSTDIQSLDLSKNKLRELPSWISNFTSLQELDLGDNEFEVFPEVILTLKQLRVLSLRSNKLLSISDSIDSLNSLQILYLENNNLEKIPDSIGNLQSLVSLILYNNKLKEIPESIGNLKKLKNLRLDTNEIVTLPDTIGNLKNLQELILWKNNLQTLPNTIGDLFNLRELNLFKNHLKKIPYSIWKIDNLVPKMAKNPLSSEDEDILNSDYESFREFCRKKASIHIFISHAVVDVEKFKIKELSNYLEEQDEIYTALYCERDMFEDIDKFMDENIPKSHILLFIATPESIKSKACLHELKLAMENNLAIIPLKSQDLEWENLSDLSESLKDLNLDRKVGLEYTIDDLDNLYTSLYEMIVKYKRSINLFVRKNHDVDELIYNIKEKIDKIIDSKQFNKYVTKEYKEIMEKINHLEIESENIDSESIESIINIIVKIRK